MARTQYEHLVARPHRWRRQLYLRERNMTVGQLVATMRANHLSAEEIAADLDLPLAHVQEALDYYRTHADLIDQELREERRQLESRGYTVRPPRTSD